MGQSDERLLYTSNISVPVNIMKTDYTRRNKVSELSRPYHTDSRIFSFKPEVMIAAPITNSFCYNCFRVIHMINLSISHRIREGVIDLPSVSC